MRTTFLLAVFTLFAATPATALESSYKAATCGDHWLTVDVELNFGTMTAHIILSGDSQPDSTPVEGTVRQEGATTTVKFADGSGRELTIEADSGDPGYYWGSFRDGENSTLRSLGECRVR